MWVIVNMTLLQGAEMISKEYKFEMEFQILLDHYKIIEYCQNASRRKFRSFFYISRGFIRSACRSPTLFLILRNSHFCYLLNVHGANGIMQT